MCAIVTLSLKATYLLTYLLTYYNVLYASAQKAAREALRSLNWPPKQTKEHKYEYK